RGRPRGGLHGRGLDGTARGRREIDQRGDGRDRAETEHGAGRAEPDGRHGGLLTWTPSLPRTPRPDYGSGDSASSRARAKTACHIARVSLPVFVFWRLGWYEASSVRPSGSRDSAPCAK